eukprot:153743-Prymnesium_polylepis.1
MSDAVDGRSAARCRNTIVRDCAAKRHFSTDLTHPGLRHVPPPFRCFFIFFGPGPAGGNDPWSKCLRKEDVATPSSIQAPTNLHRSKLVMC